MPKNTNTSIKYGAWACMVALQLALTMAAGAQSPWEGIARMIASRARTAQEVTTRTASPSVPMPPPAGAPGLVALREVPDEIGATSASQVRLSSSAAQTLLKMTTATAARSTMTIDPAGKQPKAIDLGRESEENELLLATDLFKDKTIRRLLGDMPRFIYNPAKRPDPMIVPWVRRAAIFKELSAVADTCYERGDYDQAVEIYKRILQLGDPRFNEIVHFKLTAIAEKQNAKAVEAIASVQAVQERVELPVWVHDNTTGVIISPGHDMCLVGDYVLHSGDSIPNYPEVRVATITSRKVIYQIRNVSFEVELKEN